MLRILIRQYVLTSSDGRPQVFNHNHLITKAYEYYKFQSKNVDVFNTTLLQTSLAVFFFYV